MEKMNHPYLPVATFQQVIEYVPGQVETYTVSPIVNAVAEALHVTKIIESQGIAEYLAVDERKLAGAIQLDLGMLSIIGTKQMAITTSVAIKSRMFGAKDNDSLQEILKDEETKELYDYWTTRRHYERLLAEVETANKVKAQGLGRRTYISYYLYML